MHRLGLLYAAYRCFVAFILLLIFVLDLIVFRIAYIDPNFYFGLLSLYLMTCIGQFVGFSVSERRNLQLISFGLIDVVFFAIINLVIGEANMHVGLLFVITLFVINLVQPNRVGLGLTLASIISVVYLPFIDNWINVNHEGSMANSLILSVMFLVVRLLGGFSVRRLQVLEAMHLVQSEELSRFQEINQKIMDQIDTGYVVLDSDYSILLINPAARQMLKIWDAKNCLLLQHHHQFMNALRSNLIFRSDRISFGFKQDDIDVYVTYSVLSQERGLSLLVIEDMSKTAERLQSLKLAALGKLVASIAHEIRNPLATIVQANHLIEGATAEETQEYCEVIDRQSARINKIVQSTLEMAKTPNFTPGSIQLKSVIDSLLAEDLRDVSHLIKVDPLNETSILFDENHLSQILINLIRNALRHNNPEVSPQIYLKVAEFKDYVEIDVIDYGLGVKEEMLSQLFEPFFTTEVDGTGLGLHLSKNLSDMNRANLRYVKSEVGACFRLSCRKVRII